MHMLNWCSQFRKCSQSISSMSIYIIHAHAKLVFTISKMIAKLYEHVHKHAHARLVFTISKMFTKLYEHLHKHAHARLVFTISKMFTKLYEHLHIHAHAKSVFTISKRFTVNIPLTHVHGTQIAQQLAYSATFRLCSCYRREVG